MLLTKKIPRTLLLLSLALSGSIPASNLRANNALVEILQDAKQEMGGGSGGLQVWLLKRTLELDAESKVVQTAAGPIEYKKRGSGPVVICLNGAYGGYDESFLIGEHLIAKGFTVIGVSRPGYLRTPLSVGSSPEEQADAMIGLMDALDIDEAASLGFSAGSLTAFQMAARHPDRIWAAVLEGVGAHPDDFAPDGTYDIFRGLVGNNSLVPPLDRVSWFIYRTAKNDLYLTAGLFLTNDVMEDMPAAELAQRIGFVLGNPEQREFLRKFALTLAPYSTRRAGLYNDIKDDVSIDPWQAWLDEGILNDVTVPIQVVQAVWDGSGDFNEAKNLIVPNIPTAQLVSVEGTGHFVWLGKNTAAWEKLTVSFLKNDQP